MKSPIELIYGSARTLGVPIWQNQSNISWLVFLSKDFGQDLFNPPNIAGWQTGKQWLAGQLLEKRMSKLKNHFSEIKLHKKNNDASVILDKNNIFLSTNIFNINITMPFLQGVDVLRFKWLRLYKKSKV